MRARLRDLAGITGIGLLTVGAAMQFGLPIGLMVAGTAILAFVGYDLWVDD